MDEKPDEMIWYLAYGSNMNKSVLFGRRKIIATASIPCQVDGFYLNFEQTGLPLFEPSFCSIGQTPMISGQEGAGPGKVQPHLHGALHRISRKAMAHIQRTEGGGGHEGVGYRLLKLDPFPVRSYPASVCRELLAEQNINGDAGSGDEGLSAFMKRLREAKEDDSIVMKDGEFGSIYTLKYEPSDGLRDSWSSLLSNSKFFSHERWPSKRYLQLVLQGAEQFRLHRVEYIDSFLSTRIPVSKAASLLTKLAVYLPLSPVIIVCILMPMLYFRLRKKFPPRWYFVQLEWSSLQAWKWWSFLRRLGIIGSTIEVPKSNASEQKSSKL